MRTSLPEMTCGFLIQLEFWKKKKKKKKTMWFIGVKVEQETSAPPPKKNPGSTPDTYLSTSTTFLFIALVQLLSTLIADEDFNSMFG